MNLFKRSIGLRMVCDLRVLRLYVYKLRSCSRYYFVGALASLDENRMCNPADLFKVVQRGRYECWSSFAQSQHELGVSYCPLGQLILGSMCLIAALGVYAASLCVKENPRHSYARK